MVIGHELSYVVVTYVDFNKKIDSNFYKNDKISNVKNSAAEVDAA